LTNWGREVEDREGGEEGRQSLGTHVVGQQWGDTSPPPLPYNRSSPGHCSCVELRSWGREAEEREGRCN